MDVISKSAVIGGIYLLLSVIYGNLSSTKKRLQNLNDQELFQKNERFKMLWKIFLIVGFLSPIVLIFPLFFILQSKVVDGYLAIIIFIIIFATASGMMCLNFTKITKSEIEHRKITGNNQSSHFGSGEKGDSDLFH